MKCFIEQLILTLVMHCTDSAQAFIIQPVGDVISSACCTGKLLAVLHYQYIAETKQRLNLYVIRQWRTSIIFTWMLHSKWSPPLAMCIKTGSVMLTRCEDDVMIIPRREIVLTYLYCWRPIQYLYSNDLQREKQSIVTLCRIY